jgi:hypothetical protein
MYDVLAAHRCGPSANQVIQTPPFSSRKLCLHAMIAGIIFQEFVNAANSLEGSRKIFCFLRKHTIDRQPVVKAQIRHRLRESWTNAAQQYCHSPGLHFMQEMVEAFERNHVGVAGPLNAQHHEMNIFVLGAPFQVIETAVELRAGGLLLVTAVRLVDWKRLSYAMRASRYDAALVLVTAFSAIFISVEFSILIGVALSILMFVPRASVRTWGNYRRAPTALHWHVTIADDASPLGGREDCGYVAFLVAARRARGLTGTPAASATSWMMSVNSETVSGTPNLLVNT